MSRPFWGRGVVGTAQRGGCPFGVFSELSPSVMVWGQTHVSPEILCACLNARCRWRGTVGEGIIGGLQPGIGVGSGGLGGAREVPARFCWGGMRL